MARSAKSAPSRRAFIAFAGGGAKGLIHIGALKALEDRNVEFCGLAGTSAGAIVAALKAAGFTASNLLDPVAGTSLLDRLVAIDPEIRKATDIFEKNGWRRVALFRFIVTHFAWVTWGALALLLAIIAALVAIGASRSLPAIVAVCAVIICLFVAVFFGVRFVIGGLANVERFRNALDALLQEQLFPDEPGRTVLMRDFGHEGRPTLKIIGANLSRRRLQLFSPGRTPDVATADAVAASICLPVIFAPWRIGTSSFVDGGIVSNLPAWPFDEERELDPGALTIAIEIADVSAPPVVKRFNWLPSAVRTAIFGSGELNLRFAGEAEQLVLASSLDMLQFDLTAQMARQEVLDGEAAASIRLDNRLFRRPELYRNACEVTRGLAEDVLEAALSRRSGQVRVAIATPDRDYRHSLRLSFSAGYEKHTDEGLLIPIAGSLPGAAWTARESRFEIAPFPTRLNLPGPANRIRRKLIWPEMAWQLCIPILDEKGASKLLVYINGDITLPAEFTVEAAVTEIESAVKEFFGMIMTELSELEDDHELEEHYL